MTKDLLIICPVRGRPGNDDRLHASWAASTTGRSELVFVADDDDQTPRPHRVIRLPRASVPVKVNAAVEMHPEYSFYMFVGDDVVFSQPWEDQLLSSCPGPLSLAWAYDGAQNQHLPCHPIMTRTLYRCLGWFFYPKLQHLFVDNALLDAVRYLGYEIGMGDKIWTWRRDILIEHLHADWGKAERDELYRGVDTLWARDRAVYQGTWLSQDLWPTVRKAKAEFLRLRNAAEI
jgi:hypothetical protein